MRNEQEIKVTIEKIPNTKPKISILEIPSRTLFTGKIGDYPDKLFLEYDGVLISLDNSTNTWSYPTCVVNDYNIVKELKVYI